MPSHSHDFEIGNNFAHVWSDRHESSVSWIKAGGLGFGSHDINEYNMYIESAGGGESFSESILPNNLVLTACI